MLFLKCLWDTSLLWPARWWAPGLSPWLHSRHPLDCSSWPVRETDSAESWSLKEWLGTYKCSTWLKWVNFGMGLNVRGRKHFPKDGAARGRSEPDARSVVFWTEITSKGRGRLLSSTGSHGNTMAPIFKLVGEWAHKVRAGACGGGDSHISEDYSFMKFWVCRWLIILTRSKI